MGEGNNRKVIYIEVLQRKLRDFLLYTKVKSQIEPSTTKPIAIIAIKKIAKYLNENYCLETAKNKFYFFQIMGVPSPSVSGKSMSIPSRVSSIASSKNTEVTMASFSQQSSIAPL